MKSWYRKKNFQTLRIKVNKFKFKSQNIKLKNKSDFFCWWNKTIDNISMANNCKKASYKAYCQNEP